MSAATSRPLLLGLLRRGGLQLRFLRRGSLVQVLRRLQLGLHRLLQLAKNHGQLVRTREIGEVFETEVLEEIPGDSIQERTSQALAAADDFYQHPVEQSAQNRTRTHSPDILDLDPAGALVGANARFVERFTRVCAQAGGEEQVKSHSLPELEAFWQQAKRDLARDKG